MNLVNQENRPRIKPPPTKSKPSKHEMEVHMSSQQPKEYADEIATKVNPTGAATKTDFPSQGTADLEYNKRNREGLPTVRNQHLEVPEKSGRAEEMGSANILGRAPGKENCDGNQSWKAKSPTSCKNGEMELLSDHEKKVEYSGDGSRGWMFLDELSNLCMTTSGKKMMHLTEDQSIKLGNYQANIDIMKLNTQEKVHLELGFIACRIEPLMLM